MTSRVRASEQGQEQVGEELEVGTGCPVGQKEHGATIPRCGEFSPPSDVGLEWVSDGDSVVQGGHGRDEVDHPSEEGRHTMIPTSRDS